MSIEEILKMSEYMGVEIVDGDSGKHYILDDSGEKIEFNKRMIFGERRTQMDNIERDIAYHSKLRFELEEDKFDAHMLILKYGDPDRSDATVIRCMKNNLIQLRDRLSELELES